MSLPADISSLIDAPEDVSAEKRKPKTTFFQTVGAAAMVVGRAIGDTVVVVGCTFGGIVLGKAAMVAVVGASAVCAPVGAVVVPAASGCFAATVAVESRREAAKRRGAGLNRRK